MGSQGAWALGDPLVPPEALGGPMGSPGGPGGALGDPWAPPEDPGARDSPARGALQYRGGNLKSK